MPTARKRLYIVTNNHFDLTWRRCWDRRFTHEGWTYVSYAELEDYYFTDNLTMIRRRPDYKFEAESTAVARKFVERHPERLDELRRLAAEGRFAVTGAGDNVIDGNMAVGESLIRNFVLGLLWLEDHLAFSPKVAVRNDAFGNSAQLPQILRGCGLKWVTGVSYSPIRAPYWRGLDGSVVCAASVPVVTGGGSWLKYPPCPQCRGRGCRACGGRAIDARERATMPGPVNEERFGGGDAGIVTMAPEERLPNPEIFGWAAAQAKRYDVRFAVQEETLPHVADLIARVDRAPRRQIHPSAEANPNNSGVWVTRIKLKQHCRRQEYALQGVEALSALAARRGVGYPRAAINRVWEKLLFTLFHDAITATHVDAAYAELLDTVSAIDTATARLRQRARDALTKPARGVVSVVNPFGHCAAEVVSVAVRTRAPNPTPVDEDGHAARVLSRTRLSDGRTRLEFVAKALRPLTARTYRVAAGPKPAAPRPLGSPAIENERFRVTADEHGLTAIWDKRLGRDILRAGEWRPSELVVEHDEGSPWATLSPERTRTSLAPYTALTGAEAGANESRLTFGVKSDRHLGHTIGGLKATVTVLLRRGIERVDFAAEVDWNCYNHRVRIAMPLAFRGRGVYGIPYGAIERRSYAPTFEWAGANGDWPAVNWAGVEGRGVAVALLNRGTPSYLHEKAASGDVLMLSVLRSPAVPTYLHEPLSYEMTGFDGMRDAGHHRFEYALAACGGSFADSGVVNLAEGYNGGLLAIEGRVTLPETPVVVSRNVRLCTLKRAEKGRALVMRLVEFRGRRGRVRVTLPAGVTRVLKANLLERDGEEFPVTGGCVAFEARPWEIATLRLELGG